MWVALYQIMGINKVKNDYMKKKFIIIPTLLIIVIVVVIIVYFWYQKLGSDLGKAIFM